jgi:hypothetical protein
MNRAEKKQFLLEHNVIECSCCGELKDISDFHKNNTWTCIECVNENARNTRQLKKLRNGRRDNTSS